MSMRARQLLARALSGAVDQSPYPGAPHSRFTPVLRAETPRSKPLPTFRAVASNGSALRICATGPVADAPLATDNTLLCNVLRGMIKLRCLDTLCLQAHRQGRIPFYAPSTGEEAAVVGTTAGLYFRDEIFSQYREHGALLYRMSLSVFDQSGSKNSANVDETQAATEDMSESEIETYLLFMRQNVGSAKDVGRARQMTMHYGDPKFYFQMVSSTVATQIPHAVGAAYALKRQPVNAACAQDGQRRISVVFFGDGGSSEGDFHAGLNMAATLDAPVLFLCRNNGYAISTPSSQQFRSDGIAGRAVGGYGIAAFRVDGNDALATILAVRAARGYVVRHQKPALVELMSLRGGDHSTSDDSSLYRDKQLLSTVPDPINRFANYLQTDRKCWTEKMTSDYFERQRRFALTALERAEAEEKPAAEAVFDDVYSEPMPQSLQRQKEALLKHLRRQRSPQSVSG